MIVKCGNCSKLFQSNSNLYEVEMIDLTVSYMKCPHCKKNYITNCEDNKLRKLKKKYRGLTQKKRKQDLMKEMREHQVTLIHRINPDVLDKLE